MENEKIMNKYYNEGLLNDPHRIGYIMSLIRKLHPLTLEEWKTWYLDNIHDAKYLRSLAIEMNALIPEDESVSIDTCEEYIYDVMFRRTFNGYNKEKQALNILRSIISPFVAEAPKEWDSGYFIDFYLRDSHGRLIGIQLKPETFYNGNYQSTVDIEGKMQKFCERYCARVFVLQYKSGDCGSNIEFVNPSVIAEIKTLLTL